MNSSHLLVERALTLIPASEEFLPLINAVIGASRTDREKLWARSGAYATLSKRVVDARQLSALVPGIAQKAQRRIESLFSLVVQAIQEQQAGNAAAAADLLVSAGEVEEAERWLDKAQQLYGLALEIAQDLREKGPQILALRRLGRVARSAGRLEEAQGYYERSYRLSVDQVDVPGQVIACQGLGNLCDDRGQRALSRYWWDRGMEIAGSRAPELIWPFQINLAALAVLEGKLDAAEVHLVRARELIEAAENGEAMLFWYNNRGLLLQARGDSPRAERVYREALERSDDPFWQMRIRINLGQSLIPQGRLFEAEEEARRAEELAIMNRLIRFLVDVYELLGAVSTARADEEGFVFYEQALNVCREQGLPPVSEAAVYRGYGLLHRACGRAAEAAAYLEQARDTYAALGIAVERDKVARELQSVWELPRQGAA
ncbi:MAG: tetratricopeptide repeat protein [Gemmatimonadota bacterium]|nr:tetratricopeptide repeat protein [Gemmatimonadota bacterium]